MPENPTEPVDVSTIRQLVRLMKRYDLTAIDLIEGPTQIRLRRQGGESLAAQRPVSPAPVFTTGPLATAVSQQESSAPPPSAPTGAVIESPMVGTYYASSSPDAPPFVSVGSAVRAETTVCVIEAMKVFTDIPAGVNGTITEVLVKNGQSVEFGQPMFRVNPA